jgi:hypothetical protein
MLAYLRDRVKFLCSAIDELLRRVPNVTDNLPHTALGALGRFLNALFQELQFMRDGIAALVDISDVLADVTSSLIHDIFSFIV